MMRFLLVAAAGFVYFFIVFVILQVLDVLIPALGWPPWVNQVAIVVLLLGLVGVLIYAWQRAGRFLRARSTQGQAQEDRGEDV